MSGAKDYTQDIHRAPTHSQYVLKATETLLTFARTASSTSSLFPFVKSPTVSGATAHLVNAATGMDLPYTIPAGYEFTWFMTLYSLNNLALIQVLVDTQLYVEYYPDAYTTRYEPYEFPFTISMVDPTYAIAHLFDVTYTNLGGTDMKGSAIIFAVLEPKATPPLPKTKIVKCRVCEAETEVPVSTTKLNCSKCGAETWYFGRRVI